MPYVRRGHLSVAPRVLWSGALYMRDTHEITLSEPVSSQLHGIELVFGGYDPEESAAKDWWFQSFFVSKEAVLLHESLGHSFNMTCSAGWVKYVCSKYLYIGDRWMKGHANNVKYGTAPAGFEVDNRRMVLREVIGV